MASSAVVDVKLVQMTSAVAVLLQGIGEDGARDGLAKTPLRVARAFQAATSGRQSLAKEVIEGALFSEAGAAGVSGCGGGAGGMVVVRSIELFALCESCLLPFRIRCHISYIPSGERVIGLSKFARVAEVFAKRLQNPQRFASEVVDALADSFRPFGVATVVESWHLPWPGTCEKDYTLYQDRLGFGWVYTPVFYAKGEFDCDSWEEFLAVLQMEGIEIKKLRFGGIDGQVSKRVTCPFALSDGEGCTCHGEYPIGISGGFKSFGNGFIVNRSEWTSVPSMILAVQSLLTAVGEDPTREELHFTAWRFVHWLLTATQGGRGVVYLDNGLDISHEGYTNGSGLSNGFRNGLNEYPNGFHSPSSNNVDLGALAVHGNGSIGLGDVSLELDVSFCSLCEHHLLPFFGVMHLCYVGGLERRSIDRSVLMKIVHLYSSRVQVQERLTRQIAEKIVALGDFEGVMVVAEASHMCIMSRGVDKFDSSTTTVATIGTCSTDRGLRASLLQKISKNPARKGS